MYGTIILLNTKGCGKIQYMFEGNGLKIKITIIDTKHGTKYQKEEFISEDELNGFRINQREILKMALERASQVIFHIVEPTLHNFKKK